MRSHWIVTNRAQTDLRLHCLPSIALFQSVYGLRNERSLLIRGFPCPSLHRWLFPHVLCGFLRTGQDCVVNQGQLLRTGITTQCNIILLDPRPWRFKQRTSPIQPSTIQPALESISPMHDGVEVGWGTGSASFTCHDLGPFPWRHHGDIVF